MATNARRALEALAGYFIPPPPGKPEKVLKQPATIISANIIALVKDDALLQPLISQSPML